MKLPKKLSKATILTILFLLSRIIILLFPPAHYSDVTHDYERYANMWWYGMPPYLEHYFEYPPATIPFLIFPLLLDQLGVGKYYLNYRLGIFAFDCLLFVFIVKAFKKLKLSEFSQRISLLFYIVGGLIVKDFLYEGIDLLFAGLLAISLISILLYDQAKIRNRISFWTIFFFSGAIKFMSLPLLPLFFLSKKLSFKKELLALLIGGILIWGGPLFMYRSSLSVSVVFHMGRPLKYSSIGSNLIEGINLFTHSEHRVEEPPDFQMAGPVSNTMNRVFGIIFPVSILGVLSYGLWKLIKIQKHKNILEGFWELLKKPITISNVQIFQLLLKISLVYILTLFITGKVFSQPFSIWLLPLLAVTGFKSLKQKKTVLIAGLLFMLLLSSSIPQIPKIILPFLGAGYDLCKDYIRIGLMFYLLWLSFELPEKTYEA
ncbi:hypothetical protein GYA49_05330 [Candidatus Beckwithbacteria bacterium]|nr:hypothetical protein [Candidatus Beckwithbacteria bacterium]